MSSGGFSRRTLLAAAPALLAPALCRAADLPTAAPSAAGMDGAELGRIHDQMERFVREKKIGGAVTLVARRGHVVHLRSAGWADVEERRKMRPDSLFWIASMTKSITSAAVMTLVDDAKLSLDDPVANYIPEFKDARLRSGPASAPITLRHLLSHTSGLAQPDRKPTDGAMTLANYASGLVKAPLEFEPGSRYEYGFGLTAAGRIVEIVSARPFPKYVEKRILRPLGMDDTTFDPTESQRRRLVTTYKPDDSGVGMAPAWNPFVTPSASIRRTPEPSGGLFSTASDMFRFYQMVLSGGQLNGARVLSPAAVNAMTSPQSAGGRPLDYGLGWQIFKDAAPGATGVRLAGFGHGGAFGTNGFIDPRHEVIAILMIQRTLFPRSTEIRDAFHSIVARAVQTP